MIKRELTKRRSALKFCTVVNKEKGFLVKISLGVTGFETCRADGAVKSCAFRQLQIDHPCEDKREAPTRGASLLWCE